MAEEGQVLIKDLPTATTVSDSSYIPVDNGTLTQKITVENFNSSSNVTAKAYAEAAAGSATTAQEAIADVNSKVDAAQAQANIATTQAGYAQTYAGNAQTYAGNAQGYANSAQGSATNAAASANAASSSADAANNNAILSRSWAEGNTGAREGENTNNARYWASKAETAAQLTIDDHLDPNSTNPVENRAIYNAMQDIHATGSNIYIKTNEQTLRGKDCNISDGTTTLTATFDQTGKATFEGVVLTGSLAITATDGTRSLTDYLTVPYFGNYTKNVAFWSATITVTTTTSEFNGLTVSAKKNGVVMGSGTFSSGSASIVVPETGTYTLEVTLDWKTYTSSVTVSDTTASGSIAGFVAPISLTTTTTDFYGESISVTLDGDPITTTLAFDNTGAASFDALQTGVYVFTVTYGGEPYTSTVTVSAETSYNAPEIKMWTATINLTGSSQLQLQPISVYKDGVLVSTTLSFSAGGTATYIAHEAGTYVFKSDYDSFTYSSEAVTVSAETTTYSASITVFICTLSISTTSSELFSQTITVTKGGTTVGTTAFSAGGSATFRVHETGTYTLTCTYSGDDYSSDITIVSGDDGTTKSRTIDTLKTYNLTVTLYSAAADTVTYTDDNGSHTVVTAGQNDPSGRVPGQANNVSITITQSSVGVDPTITFYSTVAKEPTSLSTSYSKTITIHEDTSVIKVMPDGTVLYWFGYIDSNLVTCTSTDGWTPAQNYPFIDPTYDDVYIHVASASGKSCSIGTAQPVTYNRLHNIISITTWTFGGRILGGATKDLASTPYWQYAPQSTNIPTSYYTHDWDNTTAHSEEYLSWDAQANNANRTIDVYAIWYT